MLLAGSKLKVSLPNLLVASNIHQMPANRLN